jgi:integrase
MSIRKRAWTTATGERKEAWIADYTDQAGKRHIKTFDRKKDADAFHATASVEIREGIHTAASASKTIAEAGRLWLETSTARQLEASTLAAYKQHVNLHIVPYLGQTKLSQLTAPMAREFEDKLRRGDSAPGEEKGEPRSGAMVRKIMTSFGSLVSDAFERGLVGRNVVRDLRGRRKKGVERRAGKRQKGKLKVGVDIPTPKEIKAIVEALESHWRPLLMTAVFTGLRSSELRGLRWADVDLKKAELQVHQRADRYNAIGAPKSEAGQRTVPIPPTLLGVLREWKLVCPKGDLDLVFPTSSGAIHHHTNIIKQGLIPTQLRAGITAQVLNEKGKPKKDEDGKPILTARYTGLHSLRHFFASWCINRKADGGLELPPKVVQERLGHSSIVMTMDVYGHLFPRGDDSAELAAAEKALLG